MITIQVNGKNVDLTIEQLSDIVSQAVNVAETDRKRFMDSTGYTCSSTECDTALGELGEALVSYGVIAPVED